MNIQTLSGLNTAAVRADAVTVCLTAVSHQHAASSRFRLPCSGGGHVHVAVLYFPKPLFSFLPFFDCSFSHSDICCWCFSSHSLRFGGFCCMVPRIDSSTPVASASSGMSSASRVYLTSACSMSSLSSSSIASMSSSDFPLRKASCLVSAWILTTMPCWILDQFIRSRTTPGSQEMTQRTIPWIWSSTAVSTWRKSSSPSSLMRASEVTNSGLPTAGPITSTTSKNR
mmetsp:Transcript_46349/g.109693  ORF Transcript_46349/g.109693 Transcript_46349/m.109693 type:complete len:227 (-) Transcript_46349:385-1065(-)